MRKVFGSLAFLAALVLCAASAAASTLDSAANEWSFDVSYVDTDNIGKFTEIDGAWQHIFPKGYHELGVLLQYSKDDFDDSLIGANFDSTAVGPIYTWNWMPDEDRATGFLEIAAGTFSGDAGDVFDNFAQAALGAKVFVGDSAGVAIRLFFQRAMGADGIDDVDSTGLTVGIRLYSGSGR